MLDLHEQETALEDEWIPAEEARRRLQVSKGKMARLLADNTLAHRKYELDERFKLVKAEDVERLRQGRMRAKRHAAS